LDGQPIHKIDIRDGNSVVLTSDATIKGSEGSVSLSAPMTVFSW